MKRNMETIKTKNECYDTEHLAINDKFYCVYCGKEMQYSKYENDGEICFCLRCDCKDSKKAHMINIAKTALDKLKPLHQYKISYECSLKKI